VSSIREGYRYPRYHQRHDRRRLLRVGEPTPAWVERLDPAVREEVVTLAHNLVQRSPLAAKVASGG